MLLLTMTLLLACTKQAEADGSPPFPDGKASEAEATATEPSIVSIDRAAVEDHKARSPLELLDQDQEDVEKGEVEGRSDDESGGVVIAAELLDLSGLSPAEVALAEMVAEKTAEAITKKGPLGGGVLGLSQAQWFDHLKVLVGLIISVLGGVLANAIRRLTLTMRDTPTPSLVDASPDDTQRILAGQLADARMEAEGMERELRLLREAERRAADRERMDGLARQATNNLHGDALVAAMEAKGRRALAAE